MVFKINGVDMLPYIEEGGFKWQRSDLESSNAGRAMDGLMRRGRVATKVRLDITCMPLRSEDASKVLKAIYPEYVSVEYTDPMDGLCVRTMYSNNNPATLTCAYKDGMELWSGISFPLIEQ